MSAPDVIVRIDRLVVEGIAVDDPAGLTKAVGQRLAELLAARLVAGALPVSGDRPALRTSPLAYGASVPLGERIADALAGSLTTGGEHSQEGSL